MTVIRDDFRPLGRLIGSLSIAALLLASCGDHTSQTLAGNQVGELAAMPAAQLHIVVKTPAFGRPDGPVVHRLVDAGSGQAVGADEAMGAFVTARQLSTRSLLMGSRNAVALLAADGTTATAILGSGRFVGSARSAGTLPISVLEATGGWLEARGAEVQRFDSSGRLVTTMLVPKPTPGVSTLDGSPTTARIDATAGRVGALLVGADSQAYALVDNSVNALIVNLSAGSSSPLNGVGYVLDAVLGGANSAYLLTFDPSRTQNSYAVMRVDLATLKVTAVGDTGIRPADGAIDDRAQLLISPDGTVWAYASQVSSGGQRKGRLLRVNPQTLAMSPVSLPDDIGFRLIIGSDGRLYFFGGIARDLITMFDPASGTVVGRVSGGAAGSQILAVFPN